MKTNRYSSLLSKPLMLFALCLLSLTTAAQDPQLSQYFNSPLYQNPASAGQFPGKQRLVLNYRNQWNSVSIPFRTFMASLDLPVKRTFFSPDVFGAGISFISDKAGDSDFGITGAGLSLSYHKSLNQGRSHFIGLGLQLGWAQRSLSYDKLRFPEQFDGTSYNPNLPQERFPNDKLSYFDLSPALSWKLMQKNGVLYAAGFTVNHLNEPNLSFSENGEVKLHRKYNLLMQMNIPIDNYWEIAPSLQFEKQHKYREFLVGLLLRYNGQLTENLPALLYGGLHTRINDAAILSAGVEYKNYNICLSYDVNYSSLHRASIYRGGFEISIQYILDKQSNKLRREVNCPIF